MRESPGGKVLVETESDFTLNMRAEEAQQPGEPAWDQGLRDSDTSLLLLLGVPSSYWLMCRVRSVIPLSTRNEMLGGAKGRGKHRREGSVFGERRVCLGPVRL